MGCLFRGSGDWRPAMGSSSEKKKKKKGKKSVHFVSDEVEGDGPKAEKFKPPEAHFVRVKPKALEELEAGSSSKELVVIQVPDDVALGTLDGSFLRLDGRDGD